MLSPSCEQDAATLGTVFPSFPPATVQQLLRAGRCVDYPGQFTLCREGEQEAKFYVILSGRAEVHKLLEGELVAINTLTAGAYFGDIALLLATPRTATIITTEPCRVFELERENFSAVIQAHPEAAHHLWQMVAKRFLSQEEKHLVEIARLRRRVQPRPAKVFLSYARHDVDFSTRLANHLVRERIDVWLDVYRIEPGRSWARQIGEALDACDVLLLVLSPESAASPNVEDEWNYCLDQGKAVVTVRHKPCRPPYRVSKLQYIDFADGVYELALARLVATLRTQLSPETFTSPPPQP